MKKNRRLLSNALLVLLSLSSVKAMAAVTLVNYGLTSSGVAQYAPSSTAAHVTATSIDGTGSNASQYTSITGALVINAAAGATSAALAVTDKSYFEFTVTASSGYYLNLTSLSFLESSRSANKDGWDIRSSIDGFATDIQNHIVAAAYPSFVSSPTVSLIAAGYQHLSSIQFRIYTFATDGTNPAVGYKSLSLNGTATNNVPEPAPMILLALGVAGFAARRMTLAKA